MPKQKQAESDRKLYQLKITLIDTKPPIWRRVAVADDLTLEELHRVIQVVMDWEECHLHQFVTKEGRRFGPFDDEFEDDDPDLRDESKIEVRQVLRRVNEKLAYVYDFGDDWVHEVKLEKQLPVDPKTPHPRCLAGGRAAPPEDCGGVWGYEELLETLADPDHEEFEDLMEWVPEGFDPEHFDLAEINSALEAVCAPKRRSTLRIAHGD